MRYVIGLSFAALLVWMLQATGLLMALTLFLMIGTIPGTRVNLPPGDMIVLLSALTLFLLYWLLRQRPVRHVDMTAPVHPAAASPDVPAALNTTKNKARFRTSLQKGLAITRDVSRRMKYRTLNWTLLRLNAIAESVKSTARPLRLITLAFGAILRITAREVIAWAGPHVHSIIIWLGKQAAYSLKGTMLSAHKWSSLSKKLLSSLTSLLTRASSVLKRGRSLLIRSAR